jgi:hypothetical protein
MNIRQASVLDLSVLVENGKDFLRFLFPEKTPDELQLYTVLKQVLDTGIVFIAEKDGKFMGAIGGVVQPDMWFSSEINLVELFWWVVPEYRCSSAGLRLMKKFIDYGKSQDISKITMSMESISPLNDDAYIKRGFEFKEKAFVMEV